MSLDHAILGFLDYKPLSGYDLKAIFDASVNHFWTADQSQIYRTLARLTQAGFTSIEVVEQSDRPDRKVYHITPQGSAELTRWLTTDLARSPERSASLVQVFFAGVVSDEEALALLRRHAERRRAIVNELKAIREKHPACPVDVDKRDLFFWGLTLDYGIQITQATVEWFEDVIGRVERGEHL